MRILAHGTVKMLGNTARAMAESAKSYLDALDVWVNHEKKVVRAWMESLSFFSLPSAPPLLPAFRLIIASRVGCPMARKLLCGYFTAAVRGRAPTHTRQAGLRARTAKLLPLMCHFPRLPCVLLAGPVLGKFLLRAHMHRAPRHIIIALFSGRGREKR